MAKKLVIIAIVLLVLVGCGLWSPWQQWNISLGSVFGVDKPKDFARLQVSALEGEIKILVDGEEKGKVGPDGSPFVIEDIEPGKRTVRLERQADSPAEYLVFERVLDFSTEVDTVVAYELGPNSYFSAGHIITATKNYISASTKLNLVSVPIGAEVSLNGLNLGLTPLSNLELDISEVSKLSLRKAGYEDMEVSLLPENAEDRKQLKGYDINVEADLFLLPITLETITKP